MPDPWSSTWSTAAPTAGRTRTSTVDPAGLCRMALSTRMVTSWRRRSGSPVTGAGSGSSTTVHAAFLTERRQHRSRVRGDVAEVERNSFYLDDARVGPGQEQHVLDQGGHVPYLGLDVAQCLAHVLDLAASVASQVLDARPDHGERRSQLMAGVRGELPLALQRLLTAVDRRPDRDEGTAGVQIPGQKRGQQGEQAASQQNRF